MTASLDAASSDTLSALPAAESAPARPSLLMRARDPLLALIFPALVLLSGGPLVITVTVSVVRGLGF